MFRNSLRVRVKVVSAVVLCIAAMLVFVLPRGGAGAAGASLTLVAYSTPATAYGQIIPAFQKTKAGKDVTFNQSYGASGDQANAVANGLHADIVAFSLQPDIDTLVKKSIVRSNWSKGKYHGMVTDSVVVLVVRKGNPKHIHSWNDLIKPGVEVVTPNPMTSGGARWNVMAAYGAQLAQHKTKQQAITYLTKLFAHVRVQDDSARKSLQTFAGGEGDVLLSYENEAIGARQKGVSLDYIIPAQTILIENPVAITTETKYSKQSRSFLSYLYSSAAQRIFGKNGYRPVRKDVASKFHFAKPAHLFTIRTLGSWPKVQKQFFAPNTGVMAKIERAKGIAP